MQSQNTKNKFSSILHYKPCRLSELFFEYDDEVVLRSADTEFFRLRGAGHTIWHMLDGKNTIGAIVIRLCEKLEIDDFDGMCEDVVSILLRLQLKLAIVANWDPLYKSELCQELVLRENY